MKDRYVILTGSKNNAGDFLIKHRAKLLFERFRPDREIIDFNAWEKFDSEKLSVVNDSKALILLGGPSLQKNMRPNIYKMTKDLNDIKVPIISMGIGWKPIFGDYNDTYNYDLSALSVELLRRINNSGYMSSVRDYHTLRTIENKLAVGGALSFLMTGCPAYYNLGYIGKQPVEPEINKIAFSLGVSFINNISMEMLMKENILSIKKKFSNCKFEVVFHHSLDRERFMSTHNASLLHNNKHNEFARWLESNGIEFVDISGSAEKLITYYDSVDFHIGYRVHAHIFMNSVSKPSVLIAEDGRGRATKDVIGGIVLEGFTDVKNGLIHKIFSKVNKNFSRLKINKNLSNEIINNVEYEMNTSYNRTKSTRCLIDNNFTIMERFITQLP